MKVLRGISLSILTVLFLTFRVTYAQSPTEDIYNKGLEYAIQGEFQKAKEEFEKALRVDPFFRPAERNLETIKDVIEQKITRETTIHLFKGISSGNKDQYDQAFSDFNKAIEINPKFAKAYFYRGINYYKKGQYDWMSRGDFDSVFIRI